MESFMNSGSRMRAIWLCGALSVIVAVRILLARLRISRRRRVLVATAGCKLPPSYPHRDPFGFDMVTESIDAFKSKTFLARQCLQYEVHGTTFSSRYLHQTIINTIDPENIQSVLSTDFDNYGIGWRRKDAFEPLLGKSLFQLDGHAWAASRALLRPAFGKTQVNNLNMFETHVKHLVEAIKTRTMETGQADLAPLFVCLSADLTTEFIHGKSLGSLKNESDENDKNFFEAIKKAGKACEERWQLGLLGKFFPQREFYSNVKKVNTYMDQLIDNALEDESARKEGSRYDFLANLSRVTTDKKVLQDEMCMLFIAGTDALSSMLTNLFFLIGRSPDIWSKLRKEVEFLEGRPPTIKELKGLKYLQSCLNESLRLLPVLPNDSRIANEDTTLPVGGGADGKSPVFVPSGAMVTFSIMALQRRKDLWGADAEDFRPERWEKEEEKASWKFVPFLKGPRICLGHELAINEAGYVLARMAQEFEKLSRVDDDPWVESVSIGTTSANGAKVVAVF
ncbi:uncharacterized protein BP5553_00414 [Venustampulla echinocandica]|uniref:Cytochrome P450 n=1 Tax=Venustampulla echinocandica TaxID=2656787 RepID=A0A370TY30_9HELO|nr:uncharacterized protein BP5553_00414 [Venustampulla echinocandica]RDL40435.1 hypothetical protein BP5553_00414 [Venustampulla echinocandica]